nr:hypothetical protein Iba_chr15aCG2910 [Ipomoea batatas]
MAKIVWRSLLGLLTVFAVVMGEMRVRCDEWGNRNSIAQSPSMLPPDAGGKPEIFDHPKVSRVDEIGSNTITMRGGIITIIGGIMGRMESTSLESLHNAWAMEDAKG